MIQTTLATIEEKIQTTTTINDSNKTELLHLLSTLKEEVEELSKTERERAESITGFAQISAHEATRQEQDQRLLQISLEGLSSSVKEFETSHPALSETVNAICQVLSNMGI
jgi:hypothetical protein